MPRDGSGNYGLPAGNPVVTNTVISSGGWANPTLSDIASALTQSMSRDGQTTPTANLTMGNFRLTALASAVARTDAPNAGQIQDGGLTTLSSVSGTDTITATSAPAITAYASGQSFQLLSSGANTTNAVTLNINSLGAKGVLKQGVAGLVQLTPGDLQSGQVFDVFYDGTQFQLTSPASVSATQSFRNALINGNFDFWQRGTTFSFTGTLGYTADRWIGSAGTGGSASCVVSQVAIAANGEPAGAAPEKFALSFNQGNAATSTVPFLTQKIESVRTYQGRVVTLSFYANVVSGTLVVTPNVTQNFGTGGSPSGSVGTAFPSVTLTTSVQKFTVSAVVPSISGKTIGTNGDDNLACTLAFPISTAFQAVIYQIQLEGSASATPFERRPLATELQMCQRYYSKSFLLGTAPAQGAGTGSALIFSQIAGASAPQKQQIVWPVRMRGTPVVTLYNPTSANAQPRNIDVPVDCSAQASYQPASEQCYMFSFTTGAGSAVTQGIAVHWTADADL